MEENKFGKGKISSVEDLKKPVYFTCCACMSVWADALSWANANPSLVTKNPEEAESIVVLSCQVTDMSVLMDIKQVAKLKKRYPSKEFYMSGCIAPRFDIEFPEGIKRLRIPRKDYVPIRDKSLVHFVKPYWVDEFDEDQSDEFSEGQLFRKMYPLRIGSGCKFNCEYCTIRVTRGPFTMLNDYDRLEDQFREFDNILMIADSPTAEQIRECCRLAIKHKKKISVRNIEPHVSILCKEALLEAADKGVLKVFHSPVQSSNEKVLMDMRRNVKATFDGIELAKELKKLGVYIATNIIIDYKEFEQDFTEINEIYDYVDWNAYWDGKWDRNKAEKKFNKYFGHFKCYNTSP